MSAAALHILQRYWGYDSFRPGQQEIIEALLAGRDTLALLPTGGGKSVCYQVPALMQEGICLVISPLIALMKDQVDALKQKGIGALAIYSGMSHRDIVRTLENARDPYFKFLYISPERIETSLFQEYLPALHINLLAVDEAHCVTQWGYDFRPSYLRIAALREELPEVPVLAVTASATPDVQEDICQKLQLHDPLRISTSFERKNLSYSVFESESKLTKLVQVVQSVHGSGIVYCKSRKRTVEIAALLQMHGVTAAAYHAGLAPTERQERQQQWMKGGLRVMVCTNAFGMGIDKADVRFVVHVDVTDSLESYYQEAGRCGRDGQKAYAVLLYHNRDIEELQALHELRHPKPEYVKEVYTALVNFLQIPAYSGEGQRFEFDFESFAKNFNLQPAPALYALKAIANDGWIEWADRNFMPSTAVFTISKENLYRFFEAHPGLEPVATALLRTYDGIFDHPAFISEASLARVMRTSPEIVKAQLVKLASFHVISYTPQNDKPYIFFLKNRVRSEDFRINVSKLEERRKKFKERVSAMVHFVHTDRCRSQYIASYFGEAHPRICHVCDNCLNRRKSFSNSGELEKLVQEVLKHLETDASYDQLFEHFARQKEAVRYVVDYLLAEGRIATKGTGNVLTKTGKSG